MVLAVFGRIFPRRVALWIMGLGIVGTQAFAYTQNNKVNIGHIGFYYAHDIPVDELSAYDNVVLEPAHVTKAITRQFLDHGSQPVAYLSLGEIHRDQKIPRPLPKGLVIGYNAPWRSDIIDPGHHWWQDYLLTTHIPELIRRGFTGLFFDTLDSYQYTKPSLNDQRRYQQGLVKLINAIKSRYPQLSIIVNRGFELFPAIAPVVDALVAESLFRRYDAATNSYSEVPYADQQWLQNQLNRVRKLNIPVTIIDYLPQDEMDNAPALARRIEQAGYSAWVSTPALDFIGTGFVQPVPRKVLVLYNDSEKVANSDAHLYFAPVLEYLGYTPVYHSTDQPLPTYPLTHRYAGIVTWLTKPVAQSLSLQQWLMQQIDLNIPVFFGGSLSFADATLLDYLGISRHSTYPQKPLTIQEDNQWIHYEQQITPSLLNTGPEYNTSPDNTSWLTLRDGSGYTFNPIVIGPWGGVALFPYTLAVNNNNRRAWYINPFELLTQALQLKHQPAYDITTENGRRILTSHVDGDGFASRAEVLGTPYSGTVIMNEVLRRFDIAHTVSIVEGEVGPEGLYPYLTPELEPIARDIFRLPNVEPASHTFSHPFFWQPTEEQLANALYGASLPIRDYQYDAVREIEGSVNYINQRLLPDDKRVRVFLWSGSADPDAEAIALTYQHGLYNLNGGNSYLTNAFSSITGLYPTGIPSSGGWQIYAPFINENVYTNDWTGPFYGYQQVIESFTLTDQERRLKPISIYWHFYSGTKYSALNALKKVYRWALAQNPISLYISEFAPRAIGFYTGSLAQLPDQRWLLYSHQALRTVRIPKALGYPDLSCSEGIAGYRDLPQSRYLHLSSSRAVLCLQQHDRNEQVLESSNGIIEHWAPESSGITRLRLRGHQPLELTIRSAKLCTLVVQENGSQKRYRPVTNGERQTFSLPVKDTNDAYLACQP